MKSQRNWFAQFWGLGLAVVFSLSGGLEWGHSDGAIAQTDTPPSEIPKGLEDITQPDPGNFPLPNSGGRPSGVVPPTLTGGPEQIIEEAETSQSVPYGDYFGANLYGELTTADQISKTLGKLGRKTGTNPALLYVLETRKGLGLVLVLPDRPTVSLPATLQANSGFLSHVPFQLASLQPRLKFAQQTEPSNPAVISRLVPGVTSSAVKRLAKVFRSEVSDPRKASIASYQPSAKELYHWIVAPLKPTLDANQIDTLIFSLDQGLRSMPIAALYDGQQFLVEQYNLAIIPSFSLTDTRFQPLPGTQMLGMGVTQATNGLSPLPSVAVEVPTLTSQIWQGQGYLDQQATVEQFKALTQKERFSIIHLATHAAFNAGQVNRSYIQFWNSRLTLPQLRNIALNQNWSSAPTIEMLVLSACQTALGNAQAELGFTGLAVGTGVKTAVGSLWAVSDEGSLGLMSEFYRQLKTAPIRAAALRQSQLGLLRGQVQIVAGQLQMPDGSHVALPAAIAQSKSLRLTHPYYWAAFTMVGNWN